MPKKFCYHFIRKFSANLKGSGRLYCDQKLSSAVQLPSLVCQSYLPNPNPNPNSDASLPDPPYGTLTYLTLMYRAKLDVIKSF